MYGCIIALFSVRFFHCAVYSRLVYPIVHQLSWTRCFMVQLVRFAFTKEKLKWTKKEENKSPIHGIPFKGCSDASATSILYIVDAAF